MCVSIYLSPSVFYLYQRINVSQHVKKVKKLKTRISEERLKE